MNDASHSHQALHDAIGAVMALDDKYQGELLVDWVVAYAAVPPDREGVTVYGACYPDDVMPAYRALGLLDLTRHQLLNEGWSDDDPLSG